MILGQSVVGYFIHIRQVAQRVIADYKCNNDLVTIVVVVVVCYYFCYKIF